MRIGAGIPIGRVLLKPWSSSAASADQARPVSPGRFPAAVRDDDARAVNLNAGHPPVRRLADRFVEILPACGPHHRSRRRWSARRARTHRPVPPAARKPVTQPKTQDFSVRDEQMLTSRMGTTLGTLSALSPWRRRRGQSRRWHRPGVTGPASLMRARADGIREPHKDRIPRNGAKRGSLSCGGMRGAATAIFSPPPMLAGADRPSRSKKQAVQNGAANGMQRARLVCMRLIVKSPFARKYIVEISNRATQLAGNSSYVTPPYWTA